MDFRLLRDWGLRTEYMLTAEIPTNTDNSFEPAKLLERY